MLADGPLIAIVAALTSENHIIRTIPNKDCSVPFAAKSLSAQWLGTLS
jgi:hypothetical protein